MKKVILYNNKKERNIQYIISKNKSAYYYVNKKNNYRVVSFIKNQQHHKPCNLGPQDRSTNIIKYIENNKYHNLYGPAFIDKINNIKRYNIYSIIYSKDQFIKYISLYNNLSYKRTY